MVYPIDKVLDEWKAQLVWDHSSEHEKNLVLGNLNGFVAFLQSRVLGLAGREELHTLRRERGELWEALRRVDATAHYCPEWNGLLVQRLKPVHPDDIKWGAKWGPSRYECRCGYIVRHRSTSKMLRVNTGD